MQQQYERLIFIRHVGFRSPPPPGCLLTPAAHPQRSTIKLPANLCKRTDYGHRLLIRRKLNCVVVFFYL
jgi:hypothetical protein